MSIDPVTFISSEGNPGYFNRYAYVMNDPINSIDPTGMFRVDAGIQKNFPKSAAIIRNKTLRNSKVHTMSKITGARPTEIRNTFTPGSGPNVKFEVMLPSDYGTHLDGEISINSELLNHVENGVDGAIEMLEVTLEHEGTHHVDELDGIDTPGEEGLQFETETYGRPVDGDIRGHEFNEAIALKDQIRDEPYGE